MYWRYELATRAAESQLGSITGGNGSIYALRRSDYVEVDPRWGHDLSLPYLMVQRGRRAVYEPEAHAFEKPTPSNETEYRRKVRMFEHCWLIVLRGKMFRRLGPLYCDYAERYRAYQVAPPDLVYTGPHTATEDESTSIRFQVSKLSAVEIKVYRGAKVVFSRLATFRRGRGAFAFRPGAPGALRVRLAAKELRTGLGKKDSATGELDVQPAT